MRAVIDVLANGKKTTASLTDSPPATLGGRERVMLWSDQDFAYSECVRGPTSQMTTLRQVREIHDYSHLNYDFTPDPEADDFEMSDGENN